MCIRDRFKYSPKNSLPNLVNISAKSPSNIALIKYWGKKKIQIPTNPSISFTLKNCLTETTIELKKSNKFSIQLFVEGKEKASFLPKIEQFLERIKVYCPFIFDYSLTINTYNTFPHSSGIASSASAFSCLSMCIMEFENYLSGCSKDFQYQKASFLSRLGSGSASRSIYGPMAIWGENEIITNASDEFAVSFNEIHSIFKTYQDTILLVDKGTKKVSSSLGHDLMQDHPFATKRFQQANRQLTALLDCLLYTSDAADE